jgi:hypothetical protein
MYKRLLVGGSIAVLLLAGVAGANTLNSGRVENGPSLPVVDAGGLCCMQKGFSVSQGIGCSNGTGTSGGPNDVAEGLTLCSPGIPVDVLTFSYIVWTPGVPGFVTASSFAVFDGAGASPGATVCKGPAIPWATFGTYSIPITGCKITPDMTNGQGHIFVGLNQGGIGGMRWGYDSISGITGDAWIRASACGASNWGTLTGFGLPGAWVFRVCVDAQGPVEVEEFSWGDVKSLYH